VCVIKLIVGISSYPYVFLGLRDLIIFSVSCVVVDFNFIFGKELRLKAFNK